MQNAAVLAKVFNASLGLGDKFIDKNCLVKAGELWTGVKVYCTGAGTIDVTSYKTDGTYIYNRNIAVVDGVNILTIATTTQVFDMHIGISGNTAQIKTISTNSSNPNTYKLIGAVWTLSGYDFAYGIYVNKIDNSSLNGRLLAIEKTTDVKTVQQLINEYDNIELEAKEYTIDATIVIPSGKKITGIRGKTILRISAGVNVGILIQNVTDVKIEDITVIGQYPDVPTIVDMAPVASGVIDTYTDAYNETGKGNQIGIKLDTSEKIEIYGCEIKNFSAYGLNVIACGKNYRYAIRIENNWINNCFCGIKTEQEAERSNYFANVVTLNQIGFYLNSGTNMITACAFNANRVGMVIGRWC